MAAPPPLHSTELISLEGVAAEGVLKACIVATQGIGGGMFFRLLQSLYMARYEAGFPPQGVPERMKTVLWNVQPLGPSGPTLPDPGIQPALLDYVGFKSLLRPASVAFLTDATMGSLLRGVTENLGICLSLPRQVLLHAMVSKVWTYWELMGPTQFDAQMAYTNFPGAAAAIDSYLAYMRDAVPTEYLFKDCAMCVRCEQRMVRGLCSLCKSTGYCSHDCQRAAFPIHVARCNRIRAAVAGYQALIASGKADISAREAEIQALEMRAARAPSLDPEAAEFLRLCKGVLRIKKEELRQSELALQSLEQPTPWFGVAQQ